MASPNHYTKRRSPPSSVASPSLSTNQPKSKSTSGGGFLSKSVLFAVFLLALPLFPSQAPDFVGETVLLTKFWELIQLLFVGIAVAYGLFSRRNVESSSVDLRMSRVDESSLSYVSRIFPVSSVFDEELEDSCDFVDVRSESLSINASEERRSKSFVVESQESEESFEHGKINQVQAWNSQYFQGRSKVVVARPAYGVDSHIVHQPLGLPVRSLRSALRDNAAPEDDSFSGSCDGTVNDKADEMFDEVIAAPSSPAPWHYSPEMMGAGDNYHQPLSVDGTEFATLRSRSSRSTGSTSSKTSSASLTQNRFSPSRSVSEDSLNSNVEESDKEKSLQGSSRSTSPSLPQSPSLSPPPPPLPKLVSDDDTHKPASHSRHYSDGSLLEEDVRKGFEYELEGSEVRGRRTELFSKKERGSKSLKLTGESSRRGNKPRRSYPPDSIPSHIDGSDDSTIRRRDLQQKSDDQLFEDNIGKGFEANHNHPRVRKRWSRDSLELSAEVSVKEEKVSESSPARDEMFQPTNAKTSRRATHSSRGGRNTLLEKDVTRNSEDDSVDFDKSRKRDLPGNNKELKANSPICELQSRRASGKVSLRGKSVRTVRSDRHGKDLKTNGDSSDDRVEAKLDTRGRPKSRRERREELSLVPYQDKVSETRAISEPEEDVIEDTEAEQPQVTLEEEEEAAWESQSNASHDHNEVDRKAGEFIAKFREQIRLQKLTSGEQPRGVGTGIIRNSHFR